MKMVCPQCGREQGAGETYCTRCGTQLEREQNRCSDPHTALCQRRVYDDEDKFCAYCGALTTYFI